VKARSQPVARRDRSSRACDVFYKGLALFRRHACSLGTSKPRTSRSGSIRKRVVNSLFTAFCNRRFKTRGKWKYNYTCRALQNCDKRFVPWFALRMCLHCQ